MNNQIQELAVAAAKGSDWKPGLGNTQVQEYMEKFAELIVQEYAKKTIQGLISAPAFVQAMDEHYEQKWAHRFD